MRMRDSIQFKAARFPRTLDHDTSRSCKLLPQITAYTTTPTSPRACTDTSRYIQLHASIPVRRYSSPGFPLCAPPPLPPKTNSRHSSGSDLTLHSSQRDKSRVEQYLDILSLCDTRPISHPFNTPQIELAAAFLVSTSLPPLICRHAGGPRTDEWKHGG
jgi:hypothetical protein